VPATTQRDGLSTIRLIFAMFIASMVLIGVVLFAILSSAQPKDAGAVPWLVAAAGVASVVTVQWSRRRPLDTSSAAKLAATYRTYWFMGLAFAQTAGTFGFVGAFVVNRWWIFAEGFVFSAVGWISIAPTDAALGRKDDELAAAGVPYSLRQSLRDTVPPAASR